MTENEAIENLQDMYDVAFCRIKNGDVRGVIYIPHDKMDSFIVAISALEEIQQYRAIGTVEECREAVGKQKAKKPVLRNYNLKLRKSCPVCGYSFSPLSRGCPKCGQAILKESEEE